MAIFAGCCVIAAVLFYSLRRIRRTLAGIGAVIEAAVNRGARNRGDRPISDDIDPRTFL